MVPLLEYVCLPDKIGLRDRDFNPILASAGQERVFTKINDKLIAVFLFLTVGSDGI